MCYSMNHLIISWILTEVHDHSWIKKSSSLTLMSNGTHTRGICKELIMKLIPMFWWFSIIINMWLHASIYWLLVAGCHVRQILARSKSVSRRGECWYVVASRVDIVASRIDIIIASWAAMLSLVGLI